MSPTTKLRIMSSVALAISLVCLLPSLIYCYQRWGLTGLFLDVLFDVLSIGGVVFFVQRTLGELLKEKKR